MQNNYSSVKDNLLAAAAALTHQEILSSGSIPTYQTQSSATGEDELHDNQLYLSNHLKIGTVSSSSLNGTGRVKATFLNLNQNSQYLQSTPSLNSLKQHTGRQ